MTAEPRRTRRPFSARDLERLRADYRRYVDSGRLADLATEMGRSKCVLAERAGLMGLTDAAAAQQLNARRSADKSRGVPIWADKPHPRGFAGGIHSEHARETIGQKARDFWQHVSSDDKAALIDRRQRAWVANDRKGSARPHGSWKAGWREIGGKRNYYRSRWEANYARYLEWLKQRGEITDWQHEPETFWFDGIKRGVRSYLPDFRVWENDGFSALHEVKGWMDARSKTTLKRMAKYHPQERIVVIREKAYNDIGRKVGRMIEGWELNDTPLRAPDGSKLRPAAVEAFQ